MKKFFYLPIALCICMLFGGCSAFGEKIFFTFEPGIGSVFTIGELSCPENEARVYLANSFNVYGKSEKGVIWDMDIDTEKLIENVRTKALNHLTMVYAMNVYANEHDVVLTENENDKISQAAEQYMTTLSDEDKAYLDVGTKDIKKMYEHLVLAKKVYADLMSSVDEDVSEDEARVLRAYVIKVADESTAEKIEKEISAGNDFEKITRAYSEDNKEEISFGRGQTDPAVEAVAFELDNGETSDRIQGSDGIYFVHCIEKYDKTLSERNKQLIIDSRKEALIDKIINDQNDKYYSGLDQKRWEKIANESKSEVTTDKFFTTISDYIDPYK